jgi:hypothetical protein
VSSRLARGEDHVGIAKLDDAISELPAVGEDGMSGRNEQRKLGTTRGSPRRSRTAKASRISRRAVKSRCAHEWGAWGRLSDDGARQHNSGKSEDPWGSGDPTSWRCTIGSASRHSAGQPLDHEVHEGWMQTGGHSAYVGSRLKRVESGKAPLERPAFQPYWGKPAVRNDRGDRGNVGIMRSPLRASILPDRQPGHVLQMMQSFAGSVLRHK